MAAAADLRSYNVPLVYLTIGGWETIGSCQHGFTNPILACKSFCNNDLQYNPGVSSSRSRGAFQAQIDGLTSVNGGRQPSGSGSLDALRRTVGVSPPVPLMPTSEPSKTGGLAPTVRRERR